LRLPHAKERALFSLMATLSGSAKQPPKALRGVPRGYLLPFAAKLLILDAPRVPPGGMTDHGKPAIVVAAGRK